MKNKRIFIFLIPLGVVFLDQITKQYILHNFELGEIHPIIASWMRITYVQNTGVAFSMFSGNQWITIILTTILLALCIYLIIKEYRSSNLIMPIFLCLVLGGGLSNLADRIIRGFVIDMISCGNFAVFNVADIFITCGCFLLAIYLLLSGNGESNG